ncbi:MAG TPA: amino acid ABC transporter permease [Mycobacteriales bacterium]|jgi:polar amino acid transport system permease protein|nr:amino acid ABC transporter permease [Mycobacteriales bacterium]
MSDEVTRTGPADIKAVPVRHPGRWVATAVIAVLVAMLVHSFVTNDRFGWSYYSKYGFTSPILHGVVITLRLTATSMAIGIVGGVVLAVMRLSPNPVLSSVSWVYIWLFRGTPVFVQILLWYNLSYLYPHLSLGIPFGPTFVTGDTNNVISALTAGILALGLNEAAYMAEIVRAGILSVDTGQSEAAAALGMTRGLVMRRIVLPQSMRVIIPPTGNETISMLKTTALISAIAVPELLQQTQGIINRTYATVPLLLMASLWYLALTSVLTVGQYYLERHYRRGSGFGGSDEPFVGRLWHAIRYIRPGNEQAALLSTGSEHQR